MQGTDYLPLHLSTMTIAVSAVVKPSKLLQSGLIATGLLMLGIAALIGIGRIGELSIQQRGLLCAVLVFPGILAFFYVFLSRKTFHIDISGIGQIRLKEDTGIDEMKRQQKEQGKGDSINVVRLMEDSTIWPNLLLLRLRTEDHRVRTLVILPDCMDGHAFRALKVACRWIAAHNVHHADIKDKAQRINF